MAHADPSADIAGDIVEELKDKARLLHKAVEAGDVEAVARVRGLPDFKGMAVDAIPPAVQRKHCLSALAREIGFSGWSHAVTVLDGRPSDDMGTLLSPPGAAAHWNIWSASYDEARQIREEHGGYLLAYKRHFFIVDRHYVEMLGLDPEDPRWERMARDWARPRDATARREMYAMLIRKRWTG
jgi:hypothetical protein